MSGGVLLLDYDGDGWLDIYFTNSPSVDMALHGQKAKSALYRNNQDGTFTDVTDKAGVGYPCWAMGGAVGDYNNDGRPDILVTCEEGMVLYRNNGDGTFTDVTRQAHLTDSRWSTGAAFGDYDGDGFVDLMVSRYTEFDVNHLPEFGAGATCRFRGIPVQCGPRGMKGLGDSLYHNNGDGTFTDLSVKSGIDKLIGKGMGVAFPDYDNDGYTDLFISNDTFRNFPLHNNRDGTFSETGILNGVAYNENGKSVAGMGADFRDVDNDGLPDIFVVAVLGDTFPLLRNRGRDFADITSSSGVERATSGITAWGSGIYGFDNDGFKDLFATCASILDNSEEIDHMPARLRNLVLRNVGCSSGGPVRFADVSKQAGPSFQAPAAHRGDAFGDFNNDGKVDAVVVVQNARPEIWMNRSPGGNHSLLLNLVGTKSNRDGLGARVKITPNVGGP